MTSNYNTTNPVPFTTAESDYQKLIQSGKEYINKESLIDYAATDFATLRDSLISYMKAAYSKDYQNFTESDYGMMFTELVAYMGSVMSFKADALANESYLPTARTRRNVSKLLSLIGVRLKGPTSAGGSAQLVLDNAATANPTITAQNRVVTISSPLDGGQVTYTLYPVSNGKIQSLASNSTDIELSMADTYDPSTTWTNLALLEGALAQETGTFDTTDAFKSINLNQGPVIENSVQVFVTSENALSGTYKQVDNLFSASGSTDKIFEVVYDELYNATLKFGDGNLGASPPNSSAYRVVYRVGGGARGNILGNALSNSVTTSQGTGTISNTSVLTGGVDAETVDDAKANAPLVFKQQDRLVTLEDYKSFISRYVSPNGGIAIGTASTRKAYSSANVVDVFVLQKATDSQLQKATVDYKTNLLAAMEDKKMLTDQLVIVDGLIRTLDLVVTAYVDSSLQNLEDVIKGKMSSIVNSFFSYSRFGFGGKFVPQELNRKLFDLSEVRYSTIDNVSDNISVDFNEVIALNNLTINISYI
tara:strand:+ start:17773 stop:19374 length:1602 start_codon:yes stop_codon:yes gene_type:complete